MTPIPCFLKLRASSLLTSSSSTGTSLSMNSTMVTSVPMVLSSKLYTNGPAPTTTMRFGCCARVSGLAVPMIFLPSCFSAGNCGFWPGGDDDMFGCVIRLFTFGICDLYVLARLRHSVPAIKIDLVFLHQEGDSLLMPPATSRLRPIIPLRNLPQNHSANAIFAGMLHV